MSSYVLGFKDIDRTKLMIVGGKGANLGELSRMEGIRVPDGFCITTEAFNRIIGETPQINELLDQLSLLKAEDRNKICELSGEIRRRIEGTAIPEDMIEEIARFLAALGEEDAYAVRSSATAEDLPTASFAGQQDTFLNIKGRKEILKHISKCWASLYTKRAVIYRIQNGFDHRKVRMSVVVQKMVFPQASGIMFTADPVTSNRKVLSIDAGFGLGEALVSGLMNPDSYKVRSGKVTDKKIRQNSQVLTDEQILQLEGIGRRIEAHFSCPQDIEWCLADDTFYIVQSRPITTLYPIPEADDQENHAYVSVGHQQMMTDPMRPLGLSFFLLITPAPMRIAGGRLFVDVTQMLASPDARDILLNTMEQHDPLMKDALMAILGRDFIKLLPDEKKKQSPDQDNHGISRLGGDHTQIESDPALVTGLIKSTHTSIEKLKQDIRTKSGSELFDFILEDIRELKKILFDPQSSRLYFAAMDASSWINEKMNEWLGEKNAADTLSQSVPNNITSEMGLALMDVADEIRPYPEIIEYLQHVKDDNFLDELAKFDGGQGIRDAIYAYLDKYGMRCVGEIDITKTRWSEKPITLVPMILSNIKNFEMNAGKRNLSKA